MPRKDPLIRERAEERRLETVLGFEHTRRKRCDIYTDIIPFSPHMRERKRPQLCLKNEEFFYGLIMQHMTLSRTIALVLVLIVFGTSFFVAKPDPPEMVRAVSEDGLVYAETLASEASELSVMMESGGASTARVSPVYEIDGVSPLGEFASTVSIASSLDPSVHLFGVWDGNMEAWVPQEENTNAEIFSIFIPPFPARVALFQLQEVEVPRRYEEIVVELIENRPSESYRGHINLAYAFESDDYVLIREARVVGGCGGSLSGGGGAVRDEEIVESVTLRVNGNERSGFIRVTAKWDLRLRHGCVDGEVFERVK